jgi:ribose transport system permease protein
VANAGIKRSDIGKYGVFIILAVIIIFFSVITDSFLNVNNIFNVARQVSMIGICAVGMTFVLLTGGIDISVGSMIAMQSVICSYFIAVLGLPIWMGILLTLLIGCAIGLFMGFVVTKYVVPPLIATLALMTIARGVAFVITQGIPIYGLPEQVKIIGQGYLGAIPVPVIIMALTFLFGWWMLERTYLGRHIYAIGGNQEAARLSGVNVNRIKLLVYLISSLFASVAGIAMMSRINSGQPNVSVGFEMDVITGAVLGGVSVSGGEGRIRNVIAGVFIMGILSNGMVLMNLYEYWQWIVKGGVLILAVSIDNVSKGLVEMRISDRKIKDTVKDSK